MLVLLFGSFLVGLATAGPFPKTDTIRDFILGGGDIDAGQLLEGTAAVDRDLVNHEGEFTFPELVGEDGSDFDDYGNVEGGDNSFESDVGVGTFKVIPGGVKFLSEGSGLQEEEEEEQHGPGELDGRPELESPAVEKYGTDFPIRREHHEEPSQRTNDELTEYATSDEANGRELTERAWFGDIVALKARMAEADRMNADSTSH